MVYGKNKNEKYGDTTLSKKSKVAKKYYLCLSFHFQMGSSDIFVFCSNTSKGLKNETSSVYGPVLFVSKMVYKCLNVLH